jgi:hypothetical protein
MAAFVNTNLVPKTDCIQTELYDSGTIYHISPYHDRFTSFTDSPLKALNAANQKKFVATGKGDLVIELPNGVEASKLALTEVLFSLEVGYTLVSIGHLDKLGYTFSFGSGKCVIKDEKGFEVGTIPQSSKGIYKVEYNDNENVNAASETLTYVDFHKWMGHVSPGVANKLAKDSLATGLRVVDLPSGENFFCESCVYAKAIQRPVLKECEEEQASTFSGEVHSNLWGPASIFTIRGFKYYVSFTDDKTQLTYLYFLRRKSETFKAYKEFEATCKIQHHADIKVLHSD